MPHPLTHQDWLRKAETLAIEGRLFIEGRYVPALDGGSFECTNPATGARLASIAQGETKDIDLAVASALAAWNDRRWRGQAPRARMQVMNRWADLVEQHADELALLETLDMGKPISDMFNIDLPEVLRTIRYFAECIDKVEGAVTHTAPGSLHMILHEPLGVVG
ncbi:MAG: aldehyde dehydrogenase family protein, partial [Ferruginibacter sp.]|nr:aldehyde dehydrogenase family protein [Rhodoferax sp.]